MSDKKDRSYAKESTKSKPSGIRFDLEQLEFIQKRESKLTTKQKVVDFLLNKYWWEQKIEVKPNHKGLPPNYENPISELKKTPSYSVQEIQPQVVFKTVAQWVAEKRELESEEEFNKWEAKLDADTLLTEKQKKAIKMS